MFPSCWRTALAPTLALLCVGAALAQAPAQPVAAPGFRPTAAQMAGLKVVTVGKLAFREEHVTDGRIAVNGDHTTPVFSPYSGRVTQLLAGIGDSVRQGQRLAAIEAGEFVQAQNDLLAAQAAAATAHAQHNLAQATERRKHALFDAKAGALQDWEQAQADLAAAQGVARSADAALGAARNRLAILGRTEAEIDALARAEKMDALAYVQSPIAGTITDRQVGPGQFLQAGAANPVFTVSDLSSVWLVANVRESDAPFVHKGQSLEVRVVALPERVFTARVTSVAPTLDPATRRLAVRAQIANPDGALKPEMFASFSVLSGAQGTAPAVPESGVLYEGAEAHVWVVADDGTLGLRQIRPGRSANGMVEVLSGLKAGEKVIASGALFIDRAAQSE